MKAMKKLYYTSLFYLVLGLILGVFYREFTKFNNFDGYTTLKVSHPHALMLGFLFFMILAIISTLSDLKHIKGFNICYISYNFGLMLTLVTFLWRGILQVKGLDFNGLNHIAGLGHAILGGSLIWFMFIIQKSLKEAAVKLAKI